MLIYYMKKNRMDFGSPRPIFLLLLLEFDCRLDVEWHPPNALMTAFILLTQSIER